MGNTLCSSQRTPALVRSHARTQTCRAPSFPDPCGSEGTAGGGRCGLKPGGVQHPPQPPPPPPEEVPAEGEGTGTGIRISWDLEATGGGGGSTIRVGHFVFQNWPRNVLHERQGVSAKSPHTSGRCCGLRWRGGGGGARSLQVQRFAVDFRESVYLSGGGGLAQGLGIRLFAFGGAYWPLATAHSDPLWARTCRGGGGVPVSLVLHVSCPTHHNISGGVPEIHDTNPGASAKFPAAKFATVKPTPRTPPPPPPRRGGALQRMLDPDGPRRCSLSPSKTQPRTSDQCVPPEVPAGTLTEPSWLTPNPQKCATAVPLTRLVHCRCARVHQIVRRSWTPVHVPRRERPWTTVLRTQVSSKSRVLPTRRARP